MKRDLSRDRSDTHGRIDRNVGRVPRADHREAAGALRPAGSAARRHPGGAGPQVRPERQVRAERGRAAGHHQGRAPSAGGRGGRGSELADLRSRRPATRIPTSRSATCSRRRCRSSSSAGSPCRPPSSASSSASARASAPGSARSSPPRSASSSRGEVQQIERGKLVIMLNKFREAEAIIPYREQNHREHFHQGDTIRAVLKRLEETPKGPRLILSRGDPLFVKALFKLEVPEIQQQIVEIRAIAREVGSRTKVAVISRDDAIDPVGACVGLKGSRVQAVVNELGGERIDIVPWSPDPERFARLALAPARVAQGLQRPRGQDDPGRRGRGSAVARDRAERAERPARLRAHRLEDRSLLEPRVARARRRGPAVRPAAARGGDRRRRSRSASSRACRPSSRRFSRAPATRCSTTSSTSSARTSPRFRA